MAKGKPLGKPEEAERKTIEAFDEAVRSFDRDDYEAACDLVKVNMEMRLEASEDERETE